LSRENARNSKFGGFDQILRSEGMTIIRTPVRAPNANAYAERSVGKLRRECLDRILIVNRRHLEHVPAGRIRNTNSRAASSTNKKQPRGKRPQPMT